MSKILHATYTDFFFLSALTKPFNDARERFFMSRALFSQTGAAGMSVFRVEYADAITRALSCAEGGEKKTNACTQTHLEFNIFRCLRAFISFAHNAADERHFSCTNVVNTS